MRKLAFLLVTMFVTIAAMAQQPEVFTTKKSDPYASLKAQGIPTGILRDMAIGQINWKAIDAKRIIDNKTFRQVFFELYNANTKLELPTLEKLVQSSYKAQDNNTFLVSVIDIDYNQFKPGAEDKGLITFKNGQIAVKSNDAYETNSLFIAGIPAQRKFTGKTVTFDFNPEFYFSNHNTAQYYVIDFGDGYGKRTVKPGEKITINYPSEGEKIIDLIAYYSDGTTRETQFSVNIKAKAATPNEVWNVTADIPYNGAYGKVEVGIFYGRGHTTLINPVVIVDGFDPENSRGIAEIYDIANQEGMFDELLSLGYDAVVVNNLSGADYIQRNAYAFVKVLQMVNDRLRAAGSTNQIVVIGPSMGGLITRYALRYMEMNGLNHNVRLWISFDSPQRGANMPLGVQHWVRFFADEGDSEDAQRALDALNTPAAQQMLIYHYTSTYTGRFPNPYYESFYTEINNMGFPVLPRRVAIINGSGYGNGQPYGPGAQLIYYHYYSFLVDIVGDVWAVPNTTSSNRIFHGIIDILGPWYDEETISYAYTLPLDGAPGGATNTLQMMDEIDPGYGDIRAYYPDHDFIPTISSLALYGIYDPYYNVSANLGNISTPFDAIYFPNWNQQHMYIDAQSAAWFKNEILNNYKPSGIRKTNTTDMLYPKAQAEARQTEINFDGIAIFPNPADNYFVVAGAQNAKVTVYDAQGRNVLSHINASNVEQIDISNLPAGVYLVKIVADSQTSTQRLIVR